MRLTDHPTWTHLSSFWDYTRNVVSPASMTHGAHIDVWWTCENDHSFEKSLAAATCAKSPLCSKCKKISFTHPWIVSEWDVNKNGRSIDDVGSGADSAWWLCPKQHSYEMAVHNKVKGRGCPICIGRRVIRDLNDVMSFYPQLEKDYSSLNKKKFSELSASYKVPVIWECENKHVYKRAVSDKLVKSNCPYCSNEKFLEGFNSIFQTHPDLKIEWSPKNTADPAKTFWLNGKESVYWNCRRCACEFKSKVVRRAKGITNCPGCAGNVIVEGLNDLTTFAPEMLETFDYDLNDKPPSQVGKGKKVWWKCKEGHSYEASPASKIKGYGFCNICKPYSRPEQEVRCLVQKILGSDVEVIGNTYSIISPFELDIYVPSLYKAIEFNGDWWHSDEMIMKSRGITAHEYHQMKQSMALDKGIELHFVWESDWKKNPELVAESLVEFLSRRGGWYLV